MARRGSADRDRDRDAPPARRPRRSAARQEARPEAGPRLACVDLPALPLQLLLRRHPDWRGAAAVVVAEDRPQAPILWVSAEARRRGILAGHRYAQGLALDASLRAGCLEPGELAAALEELTARLRRFTPEVEPAAEEPGVFWLGAGGLELIYPSLATWACAIEADLREAGLRASVGVGFGRFGAYALARARALTHGDGVQVAASPEEEHALARQVPLAALGLRPELLLALQRLGVRTVGELLALPAGGLLERFGPELYRLHRLAAGALAAPLVPEPEVLPICEQLDLDEVEDDLPRLLFLIKRRLDRMLRALAERHQALAALHLELLLDGGERVEEQVRPAAPTLDGVQLLELVRLRLEARWSGAAQAGQSRGAAAIHQPGAGVRGLELLAAPAPAAEEQLQLFAERPRRDLEAGSRALARLRAELGEAAVVHPVLRERHLPEARFTWEPLEAVRAPRPGAAAGERPLVRRLLAAPEAGAEPGRLLAGPFVLAGGWWGREVCREYYFAEGQGGELLWVYYDRQRRRWFRHGQVE